MQSNFSDRYSYSFSPMLAKLGTGDDLSANSQKVEQIIEILI